MAGATGNAFFDAINNKRFKDLIFFVVFSGIPTRFSTLVVEDIVNVYRTGLLTFRGSTGGRIKLHKGSAEISNVTFRLQDRGGRITALVNDFVMLNRRVTIFVGFRGLAVANYQVVFVGNVINFTFNGTNYMFSTAVLQHVLKQSIFTGLGATELRDPIEQNVQTGLNVLDASTLPTSGFVVVNKELMQYAAKTEPASGLDTLDTLVRGKFDYGDGDSQHDTGDDINEARVIEENPITFALQIMTSTGTGTNGVYDVLEADEGLGIAESDIDITQFELLRDRWLPDRQFRFVILESVEAKEFLEEEIYSVINAYPRELANGKISLQVYASPLPNETGENLTQLESIRGMPKYDANYREMANRVEVFFDFDPLDEEFDSLVVIDDTDSQTNFGRIKTRKVESKGIAGDLRGEQHSRAFARRQLSRFATPPARLSATTHLREFNRQPGDLVNVTHAAMPDGIGGKGMENALFEILGKTVDWSSMKVSFKMLGTQFTAAGERNRYALIGSEAINTVDYVLATEAQRIYAHVCDTATEKMSNGDPPYVVA